MALYNGFSNLSCSRFSSEVVLHKLLQELRMPIHRLDNQWMYVHGVQKATVDEGQEANSRDEVLIHDERSVKTSEFQKNTASQFHLFHF